MKKQKKSVAVITNKDIIQSYILTTARYDYSADEKRILLKLVETFQKLIEGEKLQGKINKTLFGDYTLEFPISHFISENTTNYERIKNAFRSLNEKKFEYEDSKIWEIIRIIEKPVIEKRENLRFELNKKIVECFLDFSKGYRKFELEISLSFSSVYSMRLYELMSGQIKPLTYTIDNLKEIFQISNKYAKINDFIKRVIEPAKKELDEKSPFSFTYEINKKGRSFHSITFIPFKQNQFRDEKLQTKEVTKNLYLSWILDRNTKDYLINSFNFTTPEIKQNYTLFQTAAKNIDLINFIAKLKPRANKANNPKGYFINALKKELEQKNISIEQ